MSQETNLIFEDELNEFFSHFEDPFMAREALKEKSAVDSLFRERLEQYMIKNRFTQCKEVLPDWMFNSETAYLEDCKCMEIISPETDSF